MIGRLLRSAVKSVAAYPASSEAARWCGLPAGPARRRQACRSLRAWQDSLLRAYGRSRHRLTRVDGTSRLLGAPNSPRGIYGARRATFGVAVGSSQPTFDATADMEGARS